MKYSAAASRRESIRPSSRTFTENWDVVETFLPLVKLWMCDLKLADPELHRRWTGQGNGRIISNLRQLADKGCR
ncbi:MAG: hypothetical protein ACLSGF_10415 [Alistipes onderdonkii]